MLTTYYDTAKFPQPFSQYRFLAIGKHNWDYFLTPTCPWVYCVSKADGCLSDSWGPLKDFLTRHKQVTAYLPPLPDHYMQCQNPPQDHTIPPYKRPMACCQAQR